LRTIAVEPSLFIVLYEGIGLFTRVIRVYKKCMPFTFQVKVELWKEILCCCLNKLFSEKKILLKHSEKGSSNLDIIYVVKKDDIF
jgi:hypothetical protein